MTAVTIIGPNLNRAGQQKGGMHVHAKGCAEIERDPKHYGYRQVKPHWTIDAESIKEVVTAIYDPDDFCYDESEWGDYAADVHFAPCVKFDEEKS